MLMSEPLIVVIIKVNNNHIATNETTFRGVLATCFQREIFRGLFFDTKNGGGTLTRNAG
jgi:hypothetical protein